MNEILIVTLTVAYFAANIASMVKAFPVLPPGPPKVFTQLAALLFGLPIVIIYNLIEYFLPHPYFTRQKD